MVQGEEQQRRAGGAVAPGVGDLVVVPTPSCGTMRGTTNPSSPVSPSETRCSAPLRAAAVRSGGRARRRPGRASPRSRPRRARGWASARRCCDAEAPRHEQPVRAGRHGLHLGHEHGRGQLAELAGAVRPLPSGPQRGQQHPGRAEGEVVDAGVGQALRRADDRLGPPVRRGECHQPGHGGLRPGSLERGEDPDGADQPVEVGAVGRGRDPLSDPLGDSVRQTDLLAAPGSSETDLGQHLGETTDPAVQPVPVPGRPRRLRDGRRRRDPGPVLPAHLVQHPSPRGVGDPAVRLRSARGHPPIMAPRPALTRAVTVIAHRGPRGNASAPVELLRQARRIRTLALHASPQGSARREGGRS